MTPCSFLSEAWRFCGTYRLNFDSVELTASASILWNLPPQLRFCGTYRLNFDSVELTASTSILWNLPPQLRFCGTYRLNFDSVELTASTSILWNLPSQLRFCGTHRLNFRAENAGSTLHRKDDNNLQHYKVYWRRRLQFYAVIWTSVLKQLKGRTNFWFRLKKGVLWHEKY